ncbi:MAG: phage minor capsid protein [Tepidisphaeraceae bacterium]
MPQSEAEIVTSWYKALADRARSAILNPGGGTDRGQAYNRARASDRLAQLQTLAGQIDKKAGEWIGRRMPQIYKEGRALADRQAVVAGVRPGDSAVKGSFNLIDSKSLHILARDTLIDLHKTSGGILATAERMLRATADNGLSQADINKIIAGGIVEGVPDTTIAALRDELRRVNNGNIVAITTKHGGTMNFAAESYAEMVVRTKTREAIVQSRVERFSELDLDLVSITGKLSSNFCSAYLNQVFSISGKSDKYPPLDSLPGGGPPFHPNCSKSIRPFIEELATDAQKQAAEPARDVSKLLNVDATQAQRLYQDLQLRTQTKQRISPVVPFNTRSAQ